MRHHIRCLSVRVGNGNPALLLADMLQQSIRHAHTISALILPEICIGYQRSITMHNTCLRRHIAHKCSKHVIYCQAERKRKMLFHPQKSTCHDTTPIFLPSQATTTSSHVRAQRGYRLHRQAQISSTPQAWISSGRPAAGFRSLWCPARASSVRWEAPVLRD